MILNRINLLFLTVWDLETGKNIATFKHRRPISAVAISEEVCISGCEGGKVKVWDLKSGDMVKVRWNQSVKLYLSAFLHLLECKRSLR